MLNKTNVKLSSLAVAGAFASAITMAGIIATPTAGYAETQVKCFGIAKAGENDCANAAGTHSCAGHSSVDFFGGDWKIAASAEACEAAGGALDAWDGINVKKS